jgi:2-oxo-3-hexenedioate decarboxylase
MLDHAGLAAMLDDAQRKATSIAPLTERHALALTDSYAIQRHVVARRLARDERVVGVKMGFTSAAMRQQMNIDHANWGRLTDRMAVDPEEMLDLTRFIHPRAEPEVVFRLNRDLVPPFGLDEVRTAIDAVAAAIEVVDTRYHEYRFKLEDNTADNSSAAAYAIGAWVDFSGDCARLPVTMSIDGVKVTEGSTADVLGDPVLSLAEAARLAAEDGQPLLRGWIVLTGGATASIPLRRGNLVEVEIAEIGSARLRVA